MLTMLVCLVATAPPGRHALLLHLPEAESESSVNDCMLMKEALQRRGWAADRIEVRATTADDIDNNVREYALVHPQAPLLVYLSGQGSVDTTKLTPQLRTNDGAVGWDTVLRAFPTTPRVELIADTGYTNLIHGFLPANVVAIVPDATWRDVRQPRQVITVVHNGKTMQVGIVSYILARELPFATSLADLAYRVNKTKDSGSMAAIWAELPRLKLLGRDSPL
jgi:hypothetical protein